MESIRPNEEKKRFIGSIELTPSEVNEMKMLGMSNPSQYLRQKREREKIENQNSQLKITMPENKSSLPIPTSNLEDAVKIAKLESELEKYKESFNQLKERANEGLGSIHTQVDEEVNKRLKEVEFNNLKTENADLKNDLKKKKKKIERFKLEIEDLKSKVKTTEIVKEFSPIAGPLLAGLGKGLADFKTGGLAGLLQGFGDLPSEPTSQLTEEDIQAIDLGKNIKAFFTEEEFEKVMQIIIVMGRRKEMIQMITNFLIRISSNKAQTITEEEKENKNEENEDYN